MNVLNEMLSGKTVAVVGPSSGIEEKDWGEYIDSFDVVVRLNHAHVDKKHRGERADIIYIDGNERIPTIKKHPDSYFVVAHPLSTWFAVRNIKTFNFITDYRHEIVDESFYYNLCKFLNEPPLEKNVRPNTGTISIFHLLSFNIKKLFIVGLDFYTAGYETLDVRSKRPETIRSDLLVGDGNDFHHPDRQLERFVDLYQTHRDKIELYPILDQVVKERLGET